MNYEEALKYIHSVEWRGSRPGLERTFELLERLGNPQQGLKFVHIAGTNGKGSTAAMVASILETSGYRTGLYTSPFIHRFNERMQVNGQMIGDQELADLTEYVRPFAEAMADPPTEFEMITALAMEFFRRRQCDVVVLEVGMGGELDSTNVIDTPEVAVITAIGLDHTWELGDTIGQIASAKAGIIKEKGDVVIYGQDPEAEAVLEARVREKHGRLYRPAYDTLRLVSRSLKGQVFDYGNERGLQIPLLGTYQLNNAAVAITTAQVLAAKDWAVTPETIRAGLRHTRWIARFELLSEQPAVLVDGSHNPQGMKATAASLREYFPQGDIHFVVGVLADKDARTMMGELLPLAHEFLTVTPPSPRAMKAEELADLLRSLGAQRVTAAASIPEACELALAGAGEAGVACGLGSLYMVDNLTRAFEVGLRKRKQIGCCEKDGTQKGDCMEFTKGSCEAFVEVLASKAPVPGGGGASSLVGAIGTALGNMVGSLTLGKKKYADVQEDIVALKAQADALQAKLLELVQKDAAMFEPLSKAYGLPRETEEQREEKARIMEEALKGACSVPLEIMERCCEAIELHRAFAAKGSALAISDVGVGVACCKAALQGASLNVFINTKSMTDRAYAEQINQKAEEMLDKYVPLADEIFADVRRRFD